jgi:hypothetical protein
LQKFDIVTLFLGVYLGIQKFRARNPVYQEVDSCIKNALKLTYEHLEHQKNFRGLRPLDPQEEKEEGREGKMCPQGKILRTPLPTPPPNGPAIDALQIQNTRQA